jgi:hypothetical protein
MSFYGAGRVGIFDQIEHMTFEITPDKKIETVQEAFNKHFPFLKIEFFKRKHEWGKPSPESQRVHVGQTLGSINEAIKEGKITLDPDNTTGWVEQVFMREFGLPVQVFRKEGSVWIETTKTDKLKLFEQNEMGRQSSITPKRTFPVTATLKTDNINS